MAALITILSCIALQRFANIGGWFQPQWFTSYLKIINPWLHKADKHLALLIVIVPIWLILALLHFILEWPFGGILNLFLSIIVLFLCIDARYVKHQLTTYFENLDKGDTHAAASAVTNFISSKSIGDTDGLQRAVSKAMLYHTFSHFLVGLFWYVIATEYGITAYFVITLLNQHVAKTNPNHAELARLAMNVQKIMEWLPARIVGFSYALVGNFSHGCAYCINHLWSGLDMTKKFVVESGLAALNASNELTAKNHRENYLVLELIDRVVIIWLAGMILIWLGKISHIL